LAGRVLRPCSVYVFLLLPVVVASGGTTALSNASQVQWGLMVYCISHAPAMRPPIGLEARPLLLFFWCCSDRPAADHLQRCRRAAEVEPTRPPRVLAAQRLRRDRHALWWMTPFTGGRRCDVLVIVGTGYLGSVVLAAVKQSLGARLWDTGSS
jgi:predicted CDP-diglyceride synthetase/phosphatidate cytidylyltransferase